VTITPSPNKSSDINFCDENVLGTEIIYKSKPTLQYNYVLITIQNDFDIIP